jgi:hypothetical protein
MYEIQKKSLVKLEPGSTLYETALKDTKVTMTCFADSTGKLSDGPYVPIDWVEKQNMEGQ